MSRKNFLASDFFITASEKEAKELLFLLPTFISETSLPVENALVHKLRFLHKDEKGEQYCVDVSLLPLNDQFVRVNLHVTYANGHAFGNDAAIAAVLQKFEQVIAAGNNHQYAAAPEKKNAVEKKQPAFINMLLSLFLSKYHY